MREEGHEIYENTKRQMKWAPVMAVRLVNNVICIYPLFNSTAQQKMAATTYYDLQQRIDLDTRMDVITMHCEIYDQNIRQWVI